jgi:hypothetical protein
MRQAHRQQKPESLPAPSFEASPWVARERVVEEPKAAPDAPLRLANEEHVIDELLDGEAIVRDGQHSPR